MINEEKMDKINIDKDKGIAEQLVKLAKEMNLDDEFLVYSRNSPELNGRFKFK
jgi:hypothetical protein